MRKTFKNFVTNISNPSPSWSHKQGSHKSHRIHIFPGVCFVTGCLRPVRGYPDFDHKSEFPSLISNRMQLKFHVPSSVWDVGWISILLSVFWHSLDLPNQMFRLERRPLQNYMPLKFFTAARGSMDHGPTGSNRSETYKIFSVLVRACPQFLKIIRTRTNRFFSVDPCCGL